MTLSVLSPLPKWEKLASITIGQANLAEEVMMPLQLEFEIASSMQLQFEFGAALRVGAGSARLSLTSAWTILASCSDWIGTLLADGIR